jgi:hypothetical protein
MVIKLSLLFIYCISHYTTQLYFQVVVFPMTDSIIHCWITADFFDTLAIKVHLFIGIGGYLSKSTNTSTQFKKVKDHRQWSC